MPPHGVERLLCADDGPAVRPSGRAGGGGGSADGAAAQTAKCRWAGISRPNNRFGIWVEKEIAKTTKLLTGNQI
jgi:hypothetical protein